MVKLLKKNKLFTTLLILTVIIFIFGLFFNALIDENTKKEISTNINNLLKSLDGQMINEKMITTTFINNFSLIILVWLLGISVIGIPIVLFLYLLKIFMLAFETVSLLSNLGLNSLPFTFIYQIPTILSSLVCFILIYYSINYSLVLIKILFLKKDYNIKPITKRYLKILLFSLLITLGITIFECFLVPKVLPLLK